MTAKALNSDAKAGTEREYPFDWMLFLVTLTLLSLGIVMVFDASYPLAIEIYGDKAYFVKKQIMWAAIGLCGLFAAKRVSYWDLRKWAVPGLIASLLMLVAVHIPHIGHGALGSQRWIGFGPIRIQPSEFAKLGLVLYLARAIGVRPHVMRDLWGGVMPIFAVAMVSIGLVAHQDIGTAMTMLLTTLIVLFSGGARSQWIIGILAVCGLGCFLMVVHKGTDNYRFKRLTAFVHPEADPQGAGYQIIHSTIALGTGGVTGLGFGESREKRLGNLPMQRTDMIFAILGEEFGLAGTSTVVLLFILLAGRGFHIAQRTKEPFGALLATGITSMIVVQALINIAVVTGCIPNTGVPLPMISYGGSSLGVTLLSIGILLNISQHPFYRETKPSRRSSRTIDEPDEKPGVKGARRTTANLLDNLEREGALR